MQAIGFDTKIADKRQAAFVIFYALNGQPWMNYPQDGSGRQELTIPTCLMINRADGNIGFVGGMVEEGESLEQAAKREVEEEIGHTINVELKPIVAHDIGPITTHAFAAEVSYEQLRKIQEDAIHGPHFGAELTGAFLPHLLDYQAVLGKGGGIANTLKASMAPSVREELVHFLLNTNIFKREALQDLCLQAGFDMEALLV